MSLHLIKFSATVDKSVVKTMFYLCVKNISYLIFFFINGAVINSFI